MDEIREILTEIIQDFKPRKFNRFFREKTDNFRQLNQPIQNYDDGDFFNGNNHGQIELPDGNQICCISFKVNKSLTERSGKKAQYEKAKKVLKDHARYNAGFFIFYDENGNFRFSLIFDIPLPNGKRNWSNFKRFTYFVSNNQTNKTFIIRVGNADFSSFDLIKDAFSVEKVTKQFYSEIANWYFWAIDNAHFPDDEDKNAEERNAKNLIRLITRIIFVWFMKEKKLVPKELFEKREIDKVLNYQDKTGSTYYKAILQNLFFATLNTKMKSDDPNSRIFIEEARKKGYVNEGYLQQGYYRYSRFIKEKELFLKLFESIPFLNGGLFESLDKKIEGKEIRIDCFSDNPKNEQRLKIPDELFFRDEELSVDLSNHLNSGNNRKVRGLIPILESYNFTMDENTPVDEEVALDPELLGKVFENLLASYNPETATTARKSTGSYYTPREIVEYMVNESLVEYLNTTLRNKDSKDKEVDEINSEFEEKIRSLFNYNNDENPFADESEKTENIIDAIEKVKILDPACGSGAFPMGVLHKLVLALHKLDPDNRIWKQRLLDRVPSEIRSETERSLQNKPLDYVRKLGLIENCIYGVDIQEIAIQISKLRFFISLLVEQEIDDTKENRDVRSLPNLETKFVAANTLIGLDKFQDNFYDKDVERQSKELFKLRSDIFYSNSRWKKIKLEEHEKIVREKLAELIKHRYQIVIDDRIDELQNSVNYLENNRDKVKSNPDEVEVFERTNLFGEKEKKELNKTQNKVNDINSLIKHYQKRIDELKNYKNNTLISFANKIAHWDPFDQNTHADWFDLEWMFGVKEGFDIVIGNPPYVRQEKIGSSFKRQLRIEHFEVANGTADLYVYFFSAGLKLLKNSGLLSFISLNKYLKARYGIELRNLIRDNYHVLRIIDFFEQPIFEAATDTAITFIKNIKNNNTTKYYPVKTLYKIDLYELTLGTYYKTIMNDTEWLFIDDLKETIINKMTIDSTTIKEYVNDKIYSGIKTAFNKAFVLDEDTANLLRNSESKFLIKKYAKSTDIKRWKILNDKKYFLATGYDINIIKKFPTAYKWLKKFEQRLKARQDQGRNWYNLRACSYYNEFDKPKIIYMHTAKKHEFYLDYGGHYINNSCYMIITDNKFLHCFLNSKLFDWYKRIKFVAYGDAEAAGRVKLDYNKMITIPIRRITENQKKMFSNIFDRISHSQSSATTNENTKDLEDQIDIMVYKLYGLSYDEVKVIDSEIENIIRREAYENFEIN